MEIEIGPVASDTEISDDEEESHSTSTTHEPEQILTFEENFRRMRLRAAGMSTSAEEMFAKIPEPPNDVHALTLNENSAAVWFHFDHSQWVRGDSITGWEIRRYRKEPRRNEWVHKGSMSIMENEVNLCQYVIPNLQENCMYRFTVCAKNVKGESLESPPSNPIMIEKELPSGWFRFYDFSSHRFFYSNMKTNESSWERPDVNPMFLDESFVLEFTVRELKHLKDIYIEEKIHFDVITIPRLGALLVEIGFSLSTSTVRNICEKYKLVRDERIGVTSTSSGEVKFGIHSFFEYMQFMLTVKEMMKERSWGRKLQHVMRKIRALRRDIVHCSCCSSHDERLGHWLCMRDNFTGREYYVHKITKEKQWQMPEEVSIIHHISCLFYFSSSVLRVMSNCMPPQSDLGDDVHQTVLSC
jgi:hypothetical protein